MTCDQAANLLSRRLDGDLAGDDADALALDAHLAECAECRATAEALQLQDAALVRAFAPRRAAAQAVVERLAPALAPRRPRRSRLWVPLASAIAAGILLAAVLLRPRDVAPTAPPVAQVTLTTGNVFTCPSHVLEWRPVTAGTTLTDGSRVRTAAAARLELRLADGAQVRLNGSTEARLVTGPAVELKSGQLWSAVPEQARPLRVTVPPETDAARRTALVALTPPGAKTDFACTGTAAVLTAVQGSATVIDRTGGETEVPAGEAATLSDGVPAARCTSTDVLLATRWLDDLLVLKGRDDPELAARVSELLSRIKSESAATRPAVTGQVGPPGAPSTGPSTGPSTAPVSPSTFEQLLRAQGDRWSEPMACYVQSPQSRADRDKRLTAARLLADLAPPSAIPDLIELLGDADGEVRLHAARALHRLTGQTLGTSPEQSARETGASIGQAQKKWRAWWERNKR
jgi:hypothetical protein